MTKQEVPSFSSRNPPKKEQARTGTSILIPNCPIIARD